MQDMEKQREDRAVREFRKKCLTTLKLGLEKVIESLLQGQTFLDFFQQSIPQFQQFLVEERLRNLGEEEVFELENMKKEVNKVTK